MPHIVQEIVPDLKNQWLLGYGKIPYKDSLVSLNLYKMGPKEKKEKKKYSEKKMCAQDPSVQFCKASRSNTNSYLLPNFWVFCVFLKKTLSKSCC